jgi:hypothetical protein
MVSKNLSTFFEYANNVFCGDFLDLLGNEKLEFDDDYTFPLGDCDLQISLMTTLVLVS